MVRLNRAQLRSELAEEAKNHHDQVAELPAARLRAGDISELAAGVARTQSLQAREEAKRFVRDIEMERQRLKNFLGLSRIDADLEIIPVRETLDGEPPVDELVRLALASRPDLRSAELAIEVAGKRIGLARSEIYQLTGIIDVNEGNPDFELGPGLGLAIPVFHQNQGRRALERARLEKAAHDYIATRDRIILEVRESHEQWKQAIESRDSWRDGILPLLQQRVEQSMRAYEAGEVSWLFVLEQNRQLLDARIKELEAATNVRIAMANLERNIGRRIGDTGRSEEHRN